MKKKIPPAPLALSAASLQTKTAPAFTHEDPEINGRGRPHSRRNLLGPFRLAQMLGLFPVTGSAFTSNSSATSTDPIEFRPCSLRLLGTICLLVVIVIMEGFGLINIFFLGKNKKDYLVSNDGLVIQYGLVVADVAPLIHYGATVLGISSLLRLAWNFSSIGPQWRLAHEESSSSLVVINGADLSPTTTTTTPSQSSPGSCALIMFLVMASSLCQAVFGTLVANLVLDEAFQNASDQSVGQYLQSNFFSKYAIGSHNFLVAIMDESFFTGILTFFISNYTVFVWIVLDLTLVLMGQDVWGLVDFLNQRPSSSNLRAIRTQHWRLCQLVGKLGQSGVNQLILAFYAGNMYFLWIHITSLSSHVQVNPIINNPLMSRTNGDGGGHGSAAFTVEQLYLAYQIWATCRQGLRFGMISHYAVKIASGLKRGTLDKFVLSYSDRSSDVTGERRHEGVNGAEGGMSSLSVPLASSVESGNRKSGVSSSTSSSSSSSSSTSSSSSSSCVGLMLHLEEIQRLKTQCLIHHNGFQIGCLFPLKKRALVFILVFMAISLLWASRFEATQILSNHPNLRNVLPDGQNTPSSEVQLVRRQHLNIVHW